MFKKKIAINNGKCLFVQILRQTLAFYNLIYTQNEQGCHRHDTVAWAGGEFRTHAQFPKKRLK